MAMRVYLPSLAFWTGQATLVPLLPSIAIHRGAPLAVAGLVIGVLTIMQVSFDIPASRLVARFGELRSMVLAASAVTVALVVSFVLKDLVSLVIAAGLVGAAMSVFIIGRHAFMTLAVPYRYRARALGLLGGTNRLGGVIGPWTAAAVVTVSGAVDSVLLVQAGFGVVAIVLLLIGRKVLGPSYDDGIEEEPHLSSVPAILRRHGRVLARVAPGAAIVSAVRASRIVLVPLWGLTLGLSAGEIAVVVGICGAVEFSLFYLSGQLMDRFGRRSAIIPSLTGLATAFTALAASVLLPDPVPWYVAAALLAAASNGLGSGALMTIGADIAPRVNPAPFLGVYRFITDLGAATAPLLIVGIVAVGSIAIAAGAAAGLAVTGAVILGRNLPRTGPPDRAIAESAEPD
jgi:MFS family permease